MQVLRCIGVDFRVGAAQVRQVSPEDAPVVAFVLMDAAEACPVGRLASPSESGGGWGRRRVRRNSGNSCNRILVYRFWLT